MNIFSVSIPHLDEHEKIGTQDLDASSVLTVVCFIVPTQEHINQIRISRLVLTLESYLSQVDLVKVGESKSCVHV